MASTRDEIRTEFTTHGHQNVVRAMNQIAQSAARMGAASAGVTTLAAGLNIVAAAAMAAAVAGASIAGGVAAIGVAAVRTTSDLQRLQVQLNTLYGSAARGKQAMAWAMKFEATSPLTLMQTVQGMARMKAFGLNPERDLETMTDTMSAFGGNPEIMDRILIAFGQIKSAGRVLGQEIMQLREVGIPAEDILRNKFGIKAGQQIGEARIPANAAINVLLNEFDKRYGGASAIQSKTLAGLISTLQSAVQRLLLVIGNTLAPVLEKWITKLTAFFNEGRVREGAGRLYAIIAAFLERFGPNLESLAKGLNFAWVWKLMAMLALAFRTLQMEFVLMRQGLARVMERIVGAFKLFLGELKALQSTMYDVASRLPFVSDENRKNLQSKSAALAVDSTRLQGEGRLAFGATPLIDMLLEMATRSVYAGQYRGDIVALSAVKKRSEQILAGSLDGVNAPTGPTGRKGNRPEDLAQSAAGNGLQGIVEQIILGGGARAGRGIKAMDINRRLLGGGKPVVEVRVKSEDGTKLGQAVAEIAQKSATDIIAAITQNPRLRTQLKAALAQ